MANTTETVTVRLVVAADGALRDLDAFDRGLTETANSAVKAGAGVDAFTAHLTRMRQAQEAGVPVLKARAAAIQAEERVLQNALGRAEPLYRAQINAERELGRVVAASSNLVVNGKLTEADALTKLGTIEQSHVANINKIVAAQTGLTTALQYTRSELEAMATAERLAASSAEGQSVWNKFSGIEEIGKSARESASVFSTELDRIDEIARLKAAEIGQAFGAQLEASFSAGISKSARESASVFQAEFGRLDELARLRAEEAGAAFNTSLNASFGIGAPSSSARDSASVFEEAARESEQYASRLSGLKAQIDPIAAAQGRLNAELEEYAAMAAKGDLSTQELAKAQALSASRFDMVANAVNKVNTSASRNAAQTANIAAQFQDVAVSAQMGMNPMMIALQQGTQLAAVFNEMENPIKGIGEAFTKVISPVSLLTIGFIGLAAVAAQWAVGMLPKVESATAAIKRHHDEIDKIVAGYDEASKASDDLYKHAQRIPLGAALAELNAQFKEAKDSIQKFKDYADLSSVAGANEFMTEDMRKLVEQFNKGEITAGQLYTKLIELKHSDLGMLGFAIKPFIDQLAEGARKAGSIYDTIIALDHISSGLSLNAGVQNALEQKLEGDRSAESYKLQLEAINALSPAQQGDIAYRQKLLELSTSELSKTRQLQEAEQARTLAVAQTQHELSMADMARLLSAQQTIDTTKLDLSLIGESIGKTTELKFVREQLAQAEAEAAQNGVSVSQAYIDKIKELGAAYGALQQKIAERQLGSDIQFERDQLGRSDIEQTVASRLRSIYGDDLTSEQAQFYANQIRVNESLEQLHDLGQDVTQGFFSDLRKNLSEGKGLWSSFADAAANALDKIADKALSMAVDGIWNMIFGGLASAFGGGGGWNIPSTFQPNGFYPAFPSANGNVFQSPGLHTYANTIVNRPTVFPFANGVGLMGEAGPEAIMPLRRTAGGKLGVEVAGGGAGNSAPVINNYINGSGLSQEQLAVALAEANRRTLDHINSRLPDAVQDIQRQPRRRGKGYF